MFLCWRCNWTWPTAIPLDWLLGDYLVNFFCTCLCLFLDLRFNWKVITVLSTIDLQIKDRISFARTSFFRTIPLNWIMLALNRLINHKNVLVNPWWLRDHTLPSQDIQVAYHHETELKFETLNEALIISKVYINQGFIVLHRLHEVTISSILNHWCAKLVMPHV